MPKESERKNLRKKVVEILKAAKITDVDDDVFSQRSIPSQHETLPLILVYIKTESIERNDESPKTYQRNLQVEIEIQSSNDNDELLADDLDDLSQAVENAIEGTDDLYNMLEADTARKLINDYDLTSILYETKSDGSNPIGSVKMVYNFEYYTDEVRAKVLPDFESFETEYHTDGNTDGDAKEVSTLPI